MWTFSFSPAKMSAPPYHPSLSSSPFHSQYHMPEIPSTPPPVALQPKSEVETFKRRISPIIPMILAFIHPIVVNFFVVDSSPNHVQKIHSELFFSLNFLLFACRESLSSL